MSLLDIYSSDMTGSIRRAVIKELLQVGASDEVIKDIVHPKFSEDQVIQKKKMWMEMRGGYFWFVGRADDVIKSSGYRIGPFEVDVLGL